MTSSAQSPLASFNPYEKLQALSVEEPSTWSKREAMWVRAQAMGLFTLKEDRYVGVRLRLIETFLTQAQAVKTTPLTPLDSCPSGFEGADLILKDGRLLFKSERLRAMTLKAALSANPAISQRLQRHAQEEKDAWALVNGALAHEAIFARLSDGFQGHLKVYFLASEQAPVSFPRLTLWTGQQSELALDLISVGPHAHLSVEWVEVVAESSSKVHMTWSRREGDEALSLNFLRASLQKDVHFSFCDLAVGSCLSRLDAHVQLMQEGSKADLAGLALLERQNQSQVNVLIEHMAPFCESSQLFKKALKDSSKSIFQGKIYIHRPAQHTQAYQLNRNLILSEQASAQSRPNLEIFADDVKASHGSTTGEVDPEALFYLLARGLDRLSAMKLLVHGFSLEVLEHMTSEEVKKNWKRKIDQF